MARFNASDPPRRAPGRCCKGFARRLVGVPAEGLRLGHLAGTRPVSVMASGGPGFGGWVLPPIFYSARCKEFFPDVYHPS